MSFKSGGHYFRFCIFLALYSFRGILAIDENCYYSYKSYENVGEKKMSISGNSNSNHGAMGYNSKMLLSNAGLAVL